MKERTSSLKGFRNSLNAERGLFQDGGFGQRTKFSKRGRDRLPKYVGTPRKVRTETRSLGLETITSRAIVSRRYNTIFCHFCSLHKIRHLIVYLKMYDSVPISLPTFSNAKNLMDRISFSRRNSFPGKHLYIFRRPGYCLVSLHFIDRRFQNCAETGK